MTQRPTQLQHPRRAALRTAFAVLVAGASLLPEVLTSAHLAGGLVGAQVLAVTTGVTRVLALPSVEAFLARFAPWLTAAPKA
jgi:hypothetical protein